MGPEGRGTWRRRSQNWQRTLISRWGTCTFEHRAHAAKSGGHSCGTAFTPLGHPCHILVTEPDTEGGAVSFCGSLERQDGPFGKRCKQANLKCFIGFTPMNTVYLRTEALGTRWPFYKLWRSPWDEIQADPAHPMLYSES